MDRNRIALCYGTRPQVIKASRLAGALASAYDVITIDTGQHYDYELNALLYEQLRVPEPDFLLDVGSGDHAYQSSTILNRSARLFEEHDPAAVVVIGDTNSTLGCALAAAQLAIPVVHVEAGLRSFNLAMVEEVNRRIVDSIASVLCAPSERAAVQLRSERSPGAVITTGDVARDVLRHALDQLGPREPLGHAPDKEPYVFATLHRAELTEDPLAFAATLRALGDIEMPIILPLHPRTRAAVERFALGPAIPSNVRIAKPFGYLETIVAIRDATAVLTDSGGVQREAYWLGVPCVTLRRETEWTETVDRGANRLVAPAEAAVLLGVAVQQAIDASRAWDRGAYGDGHAAAAICAAVGQAIESRQGTPRPVPS
jgi:UDP-N-acetylglucosamine 2-epimerase